MLHRLLTSSRFILIIAVLGSFLASLASLLFGGIKTIEIIMNILQNPISEKTTKVISVSFLEVVDLFLIGTVFYIISLGLYELFIDNRLELPSWLTIRNLDDLKEKLISGIVVILGVYFLGALVDWKGENNLLILSISIALIITALTFFQFMKSRQNNH
jgi:uncharacterized membrane protein YqhA